MNNYKTTPITTNNSIKSSKDKNSQNSNNRKNSNSNENKKKNAINCKLISIAPKSKNPQQKILLQNNNSNNNNLKSLMKKFSMSNMNKEKKIKKRN